MENIDYKEILSNATFGYAYHKIILNEKNEAVDYMFIEVNSAFEDMTGLKKEKIINKTLYQVIPNIKEDEFDWVKFYAKVAINGKKEVFEQYSSMFNKWYKIYAYSPKKEYFITIFTDITEEKREKDEYANFFEMKLDLLCIIDFNMNINRLCIDYAFRPHLSSRLTLGGRALPRKPYPYGDTNFDQNLS